MVVRDALRSRERRRRTSLYPSSAWIMEIVDTVPFEKLTAADPYDAVKSKPTPKFGCPACAGFVKVRVVCVLAGAGTAPGVTQATASNADRKRFIAQMFVREMNLPLLNANLTN
jgi:hypothetical protein